MRWSRRLLQPCATLRTFCAITRSVGCRLRMRFAVYALQPTKMCASQRRMCRGSSGWRLEVTRRRRRQYCWSRVAIGAMVSAGDSDEERQGPQPGFETPRALGGGSREGLGHAEGFTRQPAAELCHLRPPMPSRSHRLSQQEVSSIYRHASAAYSDE